MLSLSNLLINPSDYAVLLKSLHKLALATCVGDNEQCEGEPSHRYAMQVSLGDKLP